MSDSRLPTTEEVRSAFFHDPLLGKSIGNLRIVEKLGEGGFGAVYRADHQTMGTSQAIKILRFGTKLPTTAFERFQREARLMAKMEHPSIVRCFDSGQIAEGIFYFVMEHLRGQTLRDSLSEALPSWTQIRLWFSQIISALSYVHAQKIVHRDIKPENIFLHRFSPSGHPQELLVKLLDFGIASIAEEHPITKTGSIFGSPLYMAPEQIRGDGKRASPATDIYGFGAVLYEALVGRPPFVGEIGALLFGHLSSPPPPLASILPEHRWSPKLEALVQKALAKSPRDRGEDISALLPSLLEGLEEQGRLFPERATTPLSSPKFAALEDLSADSRSSSFFSPSQEPLPLLHEKSTDPDEDEPPPSSFPQSIPAVSPDSAASPSLALPSYPLLSSHPSDASDPAALAFTETASLLPEPLPLLSAETEAARTALSPVPPGLSSPPFLKSQRDFTPRTPRVPFVFGLACCLGVAAWFFWPSASSPPNVPPDLRRTSKDGSSSDSSPPLAPLGRSLSSKRPPSERTSQAPQTRGHLLPSSPPERRDERPSRLPEDEPPPKARKKRKSGSLKKKGSSKPKKRDSSPFELEPELE